MENWEEQIDVDDSDLQEILRCKSPSFSSFSQALPLRPCSQIPRSSQTLDSSNFPTLHRQSQLPFLVSETNRNEEGKEGVSKKTTSRPFIPGPAGAIQAAMRRQSVATATPFCYEEGSDGRLLCLNEEEDGDFKLNPWMCALRFVGSDSSISCPISSIKSLRKGAERIPQVVGIIKSCTPNGFGDLFVMLKDPTGTIDAVVHRKASLEEKIGGDISVGCILILEQVVAFSSDRSACYLNIMPRNVVKLIMKDCGPPEKLFVHSFAAKYVSDRNAEKLVVTGKSVKKIVDIDMERNTDGQRNLGVRQPFPDENFSYNKATAGATAATANMPPSSQSRVAEPKRLISRASTVQWTDEQLQKLFSNYEDDVVVERNIDDGQRMLGIRQPCLNETFSCNKATAAAASMPPSQNKIAEPKTLISRASAVQWTDEQLQKLFSDYEDDLELVSLIT
ncbi:hypothetical protein HPP92_002012 [Vanilla planifolia]|uniref:Homologous recombination OB-fold protein OB-fold domain-containing protein n=1 Tax=Vanilla planifolia TaxID=51239 RepID=A0A835VI31_VANPL|nr:hypothetical protein HPP92_002012 [Vanilla planifolia]